MKRTTEIFKVLKTSWGIWIQITADHRIVEDFNERTFLVSENIGLLNNLEKIRLNNENFDLIIKGLKSIEEKIKVKGKIEIELIDIQFNYTDFQSEGYYFGIINWAAKHFNFEAPNCEFHFDKEKNKYIFRGLENL